MSGSTTSRPGLLSGTAWNLAGQLLPLLVAVATIPLLIRALGLDRFGFLALAWVLVGYASLFDLGIGRALVRAVAARLASGHAAAADATARAGLSLLLGLGLVAATLLALAAEPVVLQLFRVPSALQAEALTATRLLALSLPFVMLTAGFTGVLQAHQAFRPLNLVRMAFSVASYLLPLALALAGLVQLQWVVAGVVAVRVLGSLGFAVATRRHCGLRWWPAWPAHGELRELASLGGWIGVSNIIGPLLTYLDRLLIGALVPLRAVGLYSAPYDLVSRTLVLPYAMASTFFPNLAALSPGSPKATAALSQLCRWLYLTMFPVLLAMMALAQPGMRLWLGAEGGDEAALVLQLLVAGVFVNTLAQGPATLVQAAGRPRDMALLHLAELLPFLLLLAWLTARFGIVGTALAATLRFVFDALAMAVIAQRSLRLPAWRWRALWLPAAVTTLLFALAAACRTAGHALALLLPGLPAWAWWAWRQLLQPHERQRLLALAGRWRPP
jgi:O-antigen/teichoic acid export membrane protein